MDVSKINSDLNSGISLIQKAKQAMLDGKYGLAISLLRDVRSGIAYSMKEIKEDPDPISHRK